jgi:hypothetical protein
MEVNAIKKITRINVMELWANQHPEVERWLSHLQRKGMNAYCLYRFCEWSKLTPTQLLALKAQDPTANTVEKLLDDFCNLKDSEFKNAFKFQVSIAVKSFFRWNYRDLAKACGAVTLEKKKPYNKLTKEGFRKLWSYTRNLRDRALIPFVLSTAVAKETLSLLQWRELEDNWESVELPCLNIPPEKLKGHGIGRYKGVRQITFLTGEAKRALLDYKDWMEKKLGCKMKPEDHIWLDIRGSYKPLEYDSFSTIISRLSEDSGVSFTWHDARRWVNTTLEQIAISPNWAKKVRGRKVKGEDAPYSQPAINQLREKFREAVPLLEFTSETTNLEERVKRQEVVTEIQAKLMSGEPLTTQDYDKIKAYGIKLGARRKPMPEKTEDCENGEHCEETFKQVPEAELLSHLKEGWKIVKELQSGEIILRR